MLKLRSIGLTDYRVLEGRQSIGRIRLAEERMPPMSYTVHDFSTGQANRDVIPVSQGHALVRSGSFPSRRWLRLRAVPVSTRKPHDLDQSRRSTATKNGAWHQEDGFPISKLPGSPLSFSAWLCSPSSCCPLSKRGLRTTSRSLATARRPGAG